MTGEIDKRRVFKRVALALVVAVLTLASYLCTWILVPRAAYESIISYETMNRVSPLFKPVQAYCQTEWPGAKLLVRWWWEVNAVMYHSDDVPYPDLKGQAMDAQYPDLN